MVKNEGLSATFPFLDNVSVCGHTKEELQENVKKFRAMCDKYNLTLNEEKTVLDVQALPILGYVVSKGEIKPDPERLSLLKNIAPPCDLISQKRIAGMFAYYN